MIRKLTAVLLFLTACTLLPNASALPGAETTMGRDIESTVDRAIDRVEIHNGVCAEDDLLCQLTCKILDFDEGYQDPQVSPFPSPLIIVPGPGDKGGQFHLLGHYTICVTLS